MSWIEQLQKKQEEFNLPKMTEGAAGMEKKRSYNLVDKEEIFIMNDIDTLNRWKECIKDFFNEEHFHSIRLGD